jgi:hypothetical protein
MRSGSGRAGAGGGRNPGSARGATRSSRKKGADRDAPQRPAGGKRGDLPGRKGPLSATSHPGREPVRTHASPAGRARQAIDDGRRGTGYVFGAFCPATGAAFTRPYPGRGTSTWVAFLEEGEGWRPRGSTPSPTPWAATAHLTCCCSCWRTRAGRGCSSRNAPPTSTASSQGGRGCARWLSRAAASRPGRSSPRPSRKRRTTGTRTALPSSGDSDPATGRAANPAPHSCPKPHNLPDESFSVHKTHFLVVTPASIGGRVCTVCGSLQARPHPRSRAASMSSNADGWWSEVSPGSDGTGA